MKVKGKYSESTVLYVIFLIAGLVAAVVVFAVVFNMTGGSVPEVKLPDVTSKTSASTTAPEGANDSYDPGKELSDEMKDAATELLISNYEVLSLYYITGLPHKDEPYGNEPEDGYYTVVSDKYTSLEQIEAIVDATFEKAFAKDVKADSLGYGPIYKTRDDGTLGIIKNFTPMVYDLSWDNPKFEIKPESEKSCNIELTLHRKADGSEKKVEAQMVKGSDGWRLVSIVF